MPAATRKILKNQWLVRAGIFVPVVFWLTLILAGLYNPGYDHRTDLVSILGQLGTKTQYFFSGGLILCALLSSFFLIGLFKILRQLPASIWPLVMLVPYPVSILGAAIFPFPTSMHAFFGAFAVVLPLSPLLALLIWPDYILKYKLIGVVALLFMLLGFSIYATGFYEAYLGLKQRVFHVGWSIWYIYLTKNFNRLLTEEKSLLNLNKF